MDSDEIKQIQAKIDSITEKIEKIDKFLAPYRRGDTPYDNIYRWYGEDNKIGQLLRARDELVGKRHELRVQLGIYPF